MVESEGGGLPGVSEQERLAAERAIACQLLPITYDGSPLVRAELAAALARFAAGHAVLFKVPSPSCSLVPASFGSADLTPMLALHQSLHASLVCRERACTFQLFLEQVFGICESFGSFWKRVGARYRV